MLSSDLIRWGGLAAMGGGILFVVYSLLVVATGEGDESAPLDLLAIVAYVLLVVGLVGFHALQQRNYGRIGRAGLYTTITAFVLWEILLLGRLLGAGAGLEWLVPLGHTFVHRFYLLLGGLLAARAGLEWLVPLGVLGTLVGEVLYGAATLQARVLPRWCGVLFIVLTPGTILASLAAFRARDFLWDAASILWTGLAWLALGYGLWSHRSSGAAAEQQPSRVR